MALAVGIASAQTQIGGGTLTIDPTTGLPIVCQPWKESQWEDPSNTLSSVERSGIPLTIVVKQLRDKFGGSIDIIYPAHPTTVDGTAALDVEALIINLEMKNVKASEIFGAMNLEFEAENLPCHWRLLMNGSRRVAMLKVSMADLVAKPAAERIVFNVGDLIEGGLTEEKLFRSITDICDRADLKLDTNALQYYAPGQLLIVTGNKSQIKFISEILTGLRDNAKIHAAANHPSAPGAPSTPGAPGTPGK